MQTSTLQKYKIIISFLSHHFETFIEKIRTLAEYAEINITFSVSLDEDELPEGIRESCTIDTSIAK